MGLLYACQTKVHKLNINDQDLALTNAIMLYEEKPYSGTLFSKTDTLITYQANYLHGIKHGKEQKYFYNGNLAEERFYTKGKKTGTHRAWWDNNQLKLEQHFDSIGQPKGSHREWYRNGQLSKEFNYRNGQEDGMQKSWDIKGELSANYVVIQGERFGFIGSKNCNPFNYD